MNCAREYAQKIWDQKDLSGITKYLHPQIIIHSLLGDFHGHDAMRQVVQAWLTAFPDLKVENQTVITENQRVAIQWKAQGTHLGEFKGRKPTGRKIAYEGVSLYRIENEKIVEYWAYLDMLHLLNQID